MMFRAATQVLLGLMLLFGAATLLPRSLLCFRGGLSRRGALYLLLGILAALLALMSFGFAALAIVEQV